ncbi:MAG: HD-GYP domain-containing protein [Clostridia bacterium]|nr:HD-GYP domain-containing protein [Clostridia bacterium]
MRNRKPQNMNIAYKMLDVLVVATVIIIILALVGSNEFMPSEWDFGENIMHFSDGWVDAAGNSFTPPADINGENGSVVIRNTVPYIENGRFLCIRSSQQDVTVSVDGEVRTAYSTKDTRLFGKNSASRYVFAELSTDDIGKVVEITLSSSSMYAGRVNEIFVGRSADIIINEFHSYIVSDVAAIFLLVLGTIGIALGIILITGYKRYTSIIDLGWIAVITGLWRLCESRMRQFYFGSNSAVSVMAFVFLALIPIFMLRFVDAVLSRRYKKVFFTLELISLIVFLTEFVLQISNTMDFVETMKFTLVECAVTLAVILGFLVYEAVKKNIKDYKLTAIGIFVLLASAIVDISLVNTIQKNRIFTFLGVTIMFFLTSANEIKNLIDAANETQRKQKEHAENLSIQVIKTLSAAVDAKDTYTNGHSNRVAEYSAKIAMSLGLSEAQQKEIYWMGLLHDIGKIAVADSIINKPGKLTDEEFQEIKRHPSAGAEILKNVSEMPNLQVGGRWHHERYDGKGYPDGLAGDAIPIEARIIAVADSYDAMTSNRSYRKYLPQDVVKDQVEQGKGSQFDPEFADIMLDIIREDVDYKLHE